MPNNISDPIETLYADCQSELTRHSPEESGLNGYPMPISMFFSCSVSINVIRQDSFKYDTLILDSLTLEMLTFGCIKIL